MKFKINRDHFTNALAQTLNVVGTKAAAPVLNNVLIEATQPDRIVLTTTNLDLAIQVTARAAVTEFGSTTLPAKRLAGIVRELSESEVTFDAGADHRALLTSGRSKFRIPGIGKEEFPPFPDLSEDRSISLGQETLIEMLRSVAYAQSQDETRFILNGVYFHLVDKEATLVATDGRRLAKVTRELEAALPKPGSFILPARTAGELARMLGRGEKVDIAFNERRVGFQIGVADADSGLVDRMQVVSKVVEGNYPNYQQVIPKETVHRLKLERELFAQCVHRAQLVTTEKSSAVRLRLTSALLEITASSTEFGDAHESMAVEYSGPEVSIGFNPTYLLDPMKALSKDEVFFEFKDEVSPGVIKTLENFTCVIMPVRPS